MTKGQIKRAITDDLIRREFALDNQEAPETFEGEMSYIERELSNRTTVRES